MKRYIIGIIGHKPFYDTDEVVLAVEMVDLLYSLGYEKVYLLPNDGRLVPLFPEDDLTQFKHQERLKDIEEAYKETGNNALVVERQTR